MKPMQLGLPIVFGVPEKPFEIKGCDIEFSERDYAKATDKNGKSYRIGYDDYFWKLYPIVDGYKDRIDTRNPIMILKQ